MGFTHTTHHGETRTLRIGLCRRLVLPRGGICVYFPRSAAAPSSQG